jgi:beta-lactamase class A
MGAILKYMEFRVLKDRIEKEIKNLEGIVGLSIKFINSSETIEINSQQQIWAASIIKLPIACELFKQVEEGEFSLATRNKVDSENIVEGTGVIKLLDSDDKFTLLDLAKLMLAISDNSATNQIVDLIGRENVENYMYKLGLTKTTYRHKMMFKEGRGPNLTTAADILSLLEMLQNNKLAGSKQILDILKQQQNRTGIPSHLPNNIQIAHKTGSLPEAMHDAGIVYSTNTFIFVFLSDQRKDKRLTNNVLSECAKLCYEYSIANTAAKE